MDHCYNDFITSIAFFAEDKFSGGETDEMVYAFLLRSATTNTTSRIV